MAIRDIYLRIETIQDYSPVQPQNPALPPLQYLRDGMRGHGHEDGTIPPAERDARAMTAVVYREYLDAAYLIPRTTKIIAADVNEPIWDRRVPGAVLWAHPKETLRIHVHNADTVPHSFHIHGLEYGIDSDGSWPFGTQSTDGRRSDEICPGSFWTYTYRISDDMVGAWPFHDHSSHQSEGSVRRGLFGGLIVTARRFRKPIPVPMPNKWQELLMGDLAKFVGKRNVMRQALPSQGRSVLRGHYEYLREWLMRERVRFPPFLDDRLHVPVFVHEMASGVNRPVFDSGDLEELGAGTYAFQFNAVGTYDYFCRFHPVMTGSVEVVSGGPATASVNILDSPQMGFYPSTVQIGPGGTVTWTNQSAQHHTVTSQQGASMPSDCINGRAFIGNTPTVLARSGQKIRWYVFNLDFRENWHNFHPHALRWKLAGETHDVRSIGPAESFVLDTEAPPVLILPDDVAQIQTQANRPADAQRFRLMGEFMFHCHVHHHLMNGMVGLVRAYQDVWLTPAMKQRLEDEVGLRLYDASNTIPDVDHHRCQHIDLGSWHELPAAPAVTFMHACLLPKTAQVLYWGYTDSNQSRVYDAAAPGVLNPANQPASLPGMDADLSDLWSAEHTFLNDANGTLLAHGGFTGPGTGLAGNVRAFRFDPATLTWSQTGSTADSRFYSTTLTLDDGKAITLFGSASKSIEIYDPAAGTWSAPATLPATMHHHEFYPWTYLLPSGKLFIAGPHSPAQRFDWNPPGNVEPFNLISGDRSTGGEKGTSVLLPLRPPNYDAKVVVLGGDPAAAEKTAEIIDLSAATPAWQSLPDLNVARPDQVNSVLLPDGRVAIAGGVFVGGDGGPVEILDPADLAGGWMLGPNMKYTRGYHSAMILLPDGSVLFGGDPNSQVFEIYHPGYFHLPRPQITAAPASVNYGNVFTVDCPQAPTISEAVVIRPGAVTHGFNMSQRLIECVITGGTATALQVQAPPNARIAPPGWYLLFLNDASRIPSVGRWIRLT